jgi:hypothetical protein
MHFERCGVDEEARANELIVFVVVAQDVTHILAEKTLDALAKLLYSFDVSLLHAPSAVRRIRRTGPEFPDRLLHIEVPRHVGDQIPDHGECMHGLDDDRHLQIEIAEPGHAHELGHSINLSRTRAAFPCLTVPSHGEIGSLLRLDAMNCV